ncbi:sensor histidine kinase [Micromonospora sp. DT47]|uniref:sensor histidine kinase n=1 Tax=Micromonospora sp. DT47 TaxID=3393431 RepID=UPI003CE79F2E
MHAVDQPGSRRQEAAADLALALVLLLLGLLATGPAGRNQAAATPVDAWCLTLVGIATLALTGRRIAPRATLAVVSVVVSAYLVLGYPYGPVLLSFLIAVYTVAVRLPIRSAAVAATAALAVILVHVFWSRSASPGLAGVLPGSAWVVVPFALAVAVRTNRESVARAHAEQARQLADGERLRVAREVHDVVGHGLAAIHMQAEIALHLLAKRPGQAETALRAISRTSKEALDELRVTLTVVRRDEADAQRAPAPGLDQVPQLRDRLAGAGVPVTVTVDGEPRTLPVAVDLAAYRVVQESLTNVLRHAGQATAAVRLRYAPADIAVEVTDTGRGAPTGPGPGGGYGLAGMRERVTALGGSFSAGPDPGGGFRVSATLPVEEAP